MASSVFGPMKPIEQICQETQVKDLVSRGQKIISIPNNSTLTEAIHILSVNNILSAPVEDIQAKDPKERFIGFLDMMDILGYILKLYSEEKETDIGTLHVWCRDIHKLSFKGKEFAHHNVKDCINFSESNPFLSVDGDSLLPKLLYILHKGVHRAAVVNHANEIQHIVSQTNVVGFLARKINHFGNMASIPIEGMNLGQHTRIITITSEARAINAFYQMWTNNVSSIGVVDKSGSLLANLSISDLRGLKQENFQVLLLPVLEFIEVFVKDKVIPPITVTFQSTFEYVLLKLAATHSHRVWVVDNNNRPVGIISLTDIILLLDLRVYIDQNKGLDPTHV